MTFRTEQLSDDITLYQADCRDVLPTLGNVDHIISDPPYEAVMQDKWGVLSNGKSLASVNYERLDFDSIDEIRDEVASKCCDTASGWAIFFCMAEGVRAWRDSIEKAGVKYKRAMVWVKPDAMPQFNGLGPSVGHEMMVSAWCGSGKSAWNGGGRPGTFIYTKNTIGSEHPTQKPLPLILELVRLFSNASQTILDPFMGSGTTGVACVQLGRKFIGIELDPGYFNIACRRISDELKRPRLPFDEPAKAKQEALEL